GWSITPLRHSIRTNSDQPLRSDERQPIIRIDHAQLVVEETQTQREGSQEQAGSPTSSPSADVKGLRFGRQFVVKSFTVRQAAPFEVLYLTHHAWHTLTLGLGTAKSKAIAFVFDSESTKATVDRLWPRVIPLGDVNRKLIRGLAGCEMSRFKFRKGCLTFYVYAVRRHGWPDFSCADDLRTILEAVVALKDFLDHTAMLALPSRRSITLLVDQVVVLMRHDGDRMTSDAIRPRVYLSICDTCQWQITVVNDAATQCQRRLCLPHDATGKRGSFDTARRTFDRMGEMRLGSLGTSSSCTTGRRRSHDAVVSGSCMNQDVSLAFESFDEMTKRGREFRR
ncbi:hypothetical protein B296_00010792, partial [Ensete ventricosum]